MTTYFETKEQYLTFRKAWAKASNDERCKKTLVRNEWGAYRQNGWLTSSHYVLFNLLSRRPHDNGFTPVTRVSKLKNGTYLNYGLYVAVTELKRVVQYARKETPAEWQQRAIERFLEPLKDVVSIELLASIEVPEEKIMESNWARGKTVAELIINGKAKPTTYQDLWNLYEEVA